MPVALHASAMLRGGVSMQGGLLAQAHRKSAPSQVSPVVSAVSSPSQRRDRVGLFTQLPCPACTIYGVVVPYGTLWMVTRLPREVNRRVQESDFSFLGNFTRTDGGSHQYITKGQRGSVPSPLRMSYTAGSRDHGILGTLVA